MAVKLSADGKRLMLHQNILMARRILDDVRGKEKAASDVVVAFDLSQAATGVAIFSLDGKCIACYDIDVRRQAKYKMHSILFAAFSEIFRKYRPVAVGWEQVAVSTEISGLLALAQVEGCLFAALGQAVTNESDGLKYNAPLLVPVSVSAVKKYSTGDGNPFKNEKLNKQYKRQKQKKAVMDNVKDKWDFQATTDNQADAFVIGRVTRALTMVADAWELPETVDLKALKVFIDNLEVTDQNEKYQQEVVRNILLSDVIAKENEYDRVEARIEKIRKLAGAAKKPSTTTRVRRNPKVPL